MRGILHHYFRLSPGFYSRTAASQFYHAPWHIILGNCALPVCFTARVDCNENIMIDKPSILPSFQPWRTCAVTALISLVMAGKSLAQDTTALTIIKNVPLVLGAINDQPAYFLIDTGASVTLLNESLQNRYHFEVVDNRYLIKHDIIGMGGRSALKEARTARVKIGVHEIFFINMASDLDNISAEFAPFKITIAGIIGTDLLITLGSVVDLESKTIVFRSRPAPPCPPLKGRISPL
jgi:hypothetical protein